MAEGRRLGQYELLAVAARGEMLTQYRARDTERDRPVLLSRVHAHLKDDADLVARFRRRAEELSHLRHPNIIPVLDTSLDKDALYVVADVPVGESLEQKLARQGHLEVDDTMSIVSQIAIALDFAHERGVYHHDIRPSNIYLQDKTAVLTNFSVLEAIGATPRYVAPEQLDETSAEAPDSRSDAYALGVVVYEMLTSRPPFEGTGAEVAVAHLTQRPLSPRLHNPDLFPALDAILLKALAKQPLSRYQSTGTLATALYEAVQTAQTRRMADEGVFDGDATNANESPYTSQSSYDKDEPPPWIWVGFGILLVVLIASIILLATS